MIHFSLILHHNMGMKYAEEPFNMGMFILPKASFRMGPFSDPQHTHPAIYILESPPWGFESVLLQGLGISETPGILSCVFPCPLYLQFTQGASATRREGVNISLRRDMHL